MSFISNPIFRGENSMEQSLFRKESLKRVSSPEQLSEYLHVTSPTSWVVFGAAVLLIVSLLIWSSVTAVESYAAGNAEVQDGVLTLTFDDAKKAENIEVGMNVRVGDTMMPVMSIGQDSDGNVFAVADTNLPDGTYEARVGYKSTQIIELFFN